MAETNEPNKREVFSTRIDPDLIKQLKHLAVDERKNLNQLLEEAITLLLKNRKGG
jgi:predicted HicB family RNase H-like nuclease